MDLRIEKTEKAIRNAFLKLRSEKALEKITIRELCELARINKSTFYAHYPDIYALSDTLENETIGSVLDVILHGQEYTTGNPEEFTRDLCLSFISHSSLITLLFSGREQSRLTDRIEAEVKELVFRKYPQHRGDTTKNIILSYCIQGAFHSFVNNRDAGTDTYLAVVCSIASSIRKLYES